MKVLDAPLVFGNEIDFGAILHLMCQLRLPCFEAALRLTIVTDQTVEIVHSLYKANK